MSAFKYKSDELFDSVMKAIHMLGGSATNSEIEEKVAELLQLSHEEVEDMHRGGRTKLSYRNAWAKSFLKVYGLIESSSRGVWALTAQGKKTKEVNRDLASSIINHWKGAAKANTDKDGDIPSKEKISWEEELAAVLKSMKPDAFERLSQRLLRELGFSNVEVTGKSGDGGIDGVGTIRLGGVVSFHVAFQCKRYTSSVSASVIRDFRGATMGRVDKGILITTSSFTRDAKAEAQRDGAPAIDLIDGIELAERLKDLRLGVSVEQVERVKIDKDWFGEV